MLSRNYSFLQSSVMSVTITILLLLQSGNQYNGTLPSINMVGSAGGSQESGGTSGVGQSSGGDGVEGEEQEESSSSHVVCGI